MSAQKPASWAYAEEFVTENEVVEAARRRGEELGAAPGRQRRRRAAAPAGRGGEAQVGRRGRHRRRDVRAVDAPGHARGRHPHHDRRRGRAPGRGQARPTPTPGIAHQRTRVITGRALDVLPRMTDGAYDMVVIDGDKVEYPAYVEHGIRLLRSGGVLVLDNMLWHDKVADPAARDEQTSVLRDLGKSAARRRAARPGAAARRRRRAGGRQALGAQAVPGPGPRRKPPGPLGDGDDLERLDGHGRRADDLAARRLLPPTTENSRWKSSR